MFKLEKISNLIVISDNSGQIWKVWDITEFTDRKLNNWIKKFNAQTGGQYKIVNKL